MIMTWKSKLALVVALIVLMFLGCFAYIYNKRRVIVRLDKNIPLREFKVGESGYRGRYDVKKIESYGPEFKVLANKNGHAVFKYSDELKAKIKSTFKDEIESIHNKNQSWEDFYEGNAYGYSKLAYQTGDTEKMRDFAQISMIYSNIFSENKNK